jgi:hypothetical protein
LLAQAAVDRPVVDAADSRGAGRLVTAGKAAPILLDADADPGVRRAAGDLAEDMFRVTGRRPTLSTPLLQSKDDAASDIVIVGVVAP